MLIPRLVLALALVVCVVACGREGEKTNGKPDSAAFVSDGAGDGSVWVVDGPNGGRLYLCAARFTSCARRTTPWPRLTRRPTCIRTSSCWNCRRARPRARADQPDVTARLVLGGHLAGGECEPGNVGGGETVDAKRGLEVSSMNRFRPWFVALLMTSWNTQRWAPRPDNGCGHAL
jgi:hypothetical protein